MDTNFILSAFVRHKLLRKMLEVVPGINFFDFGRNAICVSLAKATSCIAKGLKQKEKLTVSYVGHQPLVTANTEIYWDFGFVNAEKAFFCQNPDTFMYTQDKIEKFNASEFDVVFVGLNCPDNFYDLLKKYKNPCEEGPLVVELEYLTRVYYRLLWKLRGRLRTCLNQQKLAILAVALYLAPRSGCIVEAGVAAGGTTVFLAKLQRLLNIKRTIYALDTFEGMPKPSQKDYGGGFVYTDEFFRNIDLKENISYFKRNGVSQSIRPIAGRVEKTLPEVLRESPILALMLLDTDQYSGTRAGLEQGLRHLHEQGLILVDDSTVHGVKVALHEMEQTYPNITHRNISGNFDLIFPGN